jgi:hypothetical protein
MSRSCTLVLHQDATSGLRAHAALLREARRSEFRAREEDGDVVVDAFPRVVWARFVRVLAHALWEGKVKLENK